MINNFQPYNRQIRDPHIKVLPKLRRFYEENKVAPYGERRYSVYCKEINPSIPGAPNWRIWAFETR